MCYLEIGDKNPQGSPDKHYMAPGLWASQFRDTDRQGSRIVNVMATDNMITGLTNQNISAIFPSLTHCQKSLHGYRNFVENDKAKSS